ncbi:MAG: hypothetical protein HY862_11190 [Chloroflexi bacterium]|nr:hypothetical protein [Chloroflexota bacterium]
MSQPIKPPKTFLPDQSANYCQVEFWPGMQADIDLNIVNQLAIPVKGKLYQYPSRFLEIFANLPKDLSALRHEDILLWESIQKQFMPQIPNVEFRLGENISQPPFTWGECSANTLAVNFTYNTNAIYRIVSNLVEQNLVPRIEMPQLIDRACIRLASIYRAEGSFIMRNMNNNFNMFLIPRVIESLVGKSIYNSDMQEYDLTRSSLKIALDLAEDYVHLDVRQKMAIALGKGVAFIEKRMMGNSLSEEETFNVQEIAYRYYEKPLGIDHRQLLIERVENSASSGKTFNLTTILDDASETVDDLLWMLELMEMFPFLYVHLLVNTAQVSINFSSQMLSDVLARPIFRGLVERIEKQFRVVEMYCPLISFQTSLFPPATQHVIHEADVVFIKGANFFETCQIPEKDTFYAFVVFGPISRLYSGFNDYDGVFAFVPAGRTGYTHNKDLYQIQTLKEVAGSG